VTVIDDDYTEGDQWDWDQSDDSQYCPHGKFIGSWWGPDILCGWCEDGVSVKEMREILAAQRRRRADQALGIAWIILEMVPVTASSLDWWVRYVPVLIQQYGVTDADIARWEAIT
jgi:hypothetical protein